MEQKANILFGDAAVEIEGKTYLINDLALDYKFNVREITEKIGKYGLMEALTIPSHCIESYSIIFAGYMKLKYDSFDNSEREIVFYFENEEIRLHKAKIKVHKREREWAVVSFTGPNFDMVKKARLLDRILIKLGLK